MPIPYVNIIGVEMARSSTYCIGICLVEAPALKRSRWGPVSLDPGTLFRGVPTGRGRKGAGREGRAAAAHPARDRALQILTIT